METWVFLFSYIRVSRRITEINAAIRSDHNVNLTGDDAIMWRLTAIACCSSNGVNNKSYRTDVGLGVFIKCFTSKSHAIVIMIKEILRNAQLLQ